MIDSRDPIFNTPPKQANKLDELFEAPAPAVADEPKTRTKKADKPDEPRIATRETAGPGCDRWQLPKELPVTVRSKLPKYRVKLTGRGEYKDEIKFHETTARTPSQARTYAEAAHPKWDAQTAIQIA